MRESKVSRIIKAQRGVLAMIAAAMIALAAGGLTLASDRPGDPSCPLVTATFDGSDRAAGALVVRMCVTLPLVDGLLVVRYDVELRLMVLHHSRVFNSLVSSDGPVAARRAFSSS